MRKSNVARVLVIACVAIGVPLIAPDSSAQKGKGKGKPAATATATAASQVVDLDAKPANTGAAVTQAEDLGPPPQAGQMTEQAAQAKRLFDGEKWEDAALALYRVYKGETGDDEGNKQLAQYHLAIALYRLKFYQAAYGIFCEIADKPNHLKFNETLLWLSKLATDLPEPADIVERVGKYTDEQIAKFNNPNQRDLFWQLNYLLGRYKYRNRQYEEALRLFTKVARQSKYYVQAQFFSGISNVQLRKSVPAVQSFQQHRRRDRRRRRRRRGRGAHARPRVPLDGAHVLLGVAFASTRTTRRRSTRRSSRAAVKYWNKVDVASEYWLDALFEESWAYFMAGDYSHALGNIHTIQAPYFPN